MKYLKTALITTLITVAAHAEDTAQKLLIQKLNCVAPTEIASHEMVPTTLLLNIEEDFISRGQKYYRWGYRETFDTAKVFPPPLTNRDLITVEVDVFVGYETFSFAEARATLAKFASGKNFEYTCTHAD